jgi:hypothetical protein
LVDNLLPGQLGVMIPEIFVDIVIKAQGPEIFNICEYFRHLPRQQQNDIISALLTRSVTSEDVDFLRIVESIERFGLLYLSDERVEELVSIV